MHARHLDRGMFSTVFIQLFFPKNLIWPFNIGFQPCLYVAEISLLSLSLWIADGEILFDCALKNYFSNCWDYLPIQFS